MPIELSPFGVPLSVLSVDARSLQPAVFAERYGPAFFLALQSADPAPRAPQQTIASDQRAPTTGSLTMIVFPVVKRRVDALSFISVGRLQGNDIAINDASVSKLHAYIKQQQGGVHTIEDNDSKNGTFVDGVRVPVRGEGPPTVLPSRGAVRFGTMHTSFLSAAHLVELVRAMPAETGP